MNAFKRVVVFLYHKKNELKLKRIKKGFRSVGEGLLVYGTPRVTAPQRISLGNNVTLNDGCILNATSSSIVIGDNVTISADAKILAATYDAKEFLQEHNRKHIDCPVTIGDNVWVCADAIILPGVTIRGGVIVAAGAVVTHDITENNVIVAGNPARIVKSCEE